MKKTKCLIVNAPKESFFDMPDLITFIDLSNESENVEPEIYSSDETEYLDLNAPEESFFGMPDLLNKSENDEPEIYSSDEPEIYSSDETMEETEYLDLNAPKESIIDISTIGEEKEEELETRDPVDLFQNGLIEFFFEHYENLELVLSKMIGKLSGILSIYETVQSDYPNIVQNYAIAGILKDFYRKVIIKLPQRANAVKNKSFFTRFYLKNIHSSIYPRIEIVISHEALILCNENKFCEIRLTN